MDIQTVGAWGEFLGGIGGLVAAIGVIATLVYLAAQIRHNTRAVQSSSWQAAISSYLDFNFLVAGNSEFADLAFKGASDPSSLDANQWSRFCVAFSGLFHVFEKLYIDSQRGIVDREVWLGSEKVVLRLLVTPGIAQWLREEGTGFTSDFTAYLDSKLTLLDETRSS